MGHSVRRHLGLDIGAYDTTIRLFIPGYEAMLGEAAEAALSVRTSIRRTGPIGPADLASSRNGYRPVPASDAR